MHAEDLAGNDGRNRQGVEDIDKRLPRLDVCPALAFIVEPIDPCNVRTLVVTAKEEEVFREFDLVAEQEEDGFEGLFAAVDIVAEEKVVCLWWEATHLKHAYEVGILRGQK